MRKDSNLLLANQLKKMQTTILVQPTMTSLEIAELTGKQHKDVMKTIRNMEPAWLKVNGRKFALVEYQDKRVGTNCLCLRSIRASTANCCVLSWQCGWASATTGLTCGQSTKHIALSFPKVHLLMLIRRRETPSRPPRGEGD